MELELQKEQVVLLNEPAFAAEDGRHALRIQIPYEHGKIEYRLLHCRNASLNADNWRLHDARLLESGKPPTVLTERGEWELALFLSDPGDFVGGILHGNETTVSVGLRIDGEAVELSGEVFQHTGKSILICMVSNLTVPGSPEECFAVHKKKYLFDRSGLQITQSVEWLKETGLGRCYMAMFPISKRYSEVLRPENSAEWIRLDTGPELCRSGIRKVETGTKDLSFTAAFAVSKMPDTGRDLQRFLVSDNGGREYHKMYYMVFSEGTARAGDCWESVSHYTWKPN